MKQKTRRHSRAFFEKLVRNELHDLPESVQQETIDKLVQYDCPILTAQKTRAVLNKIKSQFNEANIAPSESIGIVAAQSLGESSTQLVLRTFHYAGVASEYMRGGLARVQEIINAVRHIKNPSMRIVIKHKRAEKRIIEQIKSLRGVSSLTITQEDGKTVIYTRGSNLRDAMEIDGVSVITNNIREIEDVLGIEAARAAIINELYGVYKSSGLDVDIRHIILIADMMTVNGYVEPLNRVGAMRHKKSIIAKMAFEAPISNLYTAAVTGAIDDLDGITENIIVGKPINRGTGSSLIVLEYKDNK